MSYSVAMSFQFHILNSLCSRSVFRDFSDGGVGIHRYERPGWWSVVLPYLDL
jgi:hypothetical protein